MEDIKQLEAEERRLQSRVDSLHRFNRLVARDKELSDRYEEANVAGDLGRQIGLVKASTENAWAIKRLSKCFELDPIIDSTVNRERNRRNIRAAEIQIKIAPKLIRNLEQLKALKDSERGF